VYDVIQSRNVSNNFRKKIKFKIRWKFLCLMRTDGRTRREY